MHYWLFKSEPSCFSLDDLINTPGQTTMWDGVRNYQARNFIRDEMKPGDSVLFYNSNTNVGITGLVQIVSAPYADPTQWDPDNAHFDPASKHDDPRWFAVDVHFIRKFPRVLQRKELGSVTALQGMEVLRKGSRLSITPVQKAEFEAIIDLAKQGHV